MVWFAAIRAHKMLYACAGGLVVLNTLPHVVPIVTRKSLEFSDIQAPKELETHVRKIAEGMDVPNPERIKVFITTGYASVCGGCTSLPLGAIIGLPRTVLFRGPEDVVISNALLAGDPVGWDSREGKKLMKLLPPSTKVINFRIAHEIAHVKKLDFIPGIVLSPAMLIVGYHTAKFVSKYAFPSQVTMSFSVLLLMTLLAYVEVFSILRHWQEYRADMIAASSNKSYSEGGIEFIRNQMELEALSSPRTWLSKLLSNFSDHPPHNKRLEKLEGHLSLHETNSDDFETDG